MSLLNNRLFTRKKKKLFNLSIISNIFLFSIPFYICIYGKLFGGDFFLDYPYIGLIFVHVPLQ